MIINTIIILAIIALGVILLKINRIWSEVAGLGVIIIGSILLCVHTIYLCSYSYEFRKFNASRNAFIETLESARKKQDGIELASISKDIATWNQKLACYQYDNKIWVLKPYIDDRFDSLKLIK